MMKKTSAGWHKFLDKLSTQRERIADGLKAAEQAVNQHRLGKFAGEAKAVKEYDSAVADLSEITRQREELDLAIAQAEAELRSVEIFEKRAEAQAAVDKLEPLLDKHLSLGQDIDRLLAELGDKLATREHLRSEVIRALPNIGKPGARARVANALSDKARHFNGAMPLLMCRAFEIARPWAAERAPFAHHAQHAVESARRILANAVLSVGGEQGEVKRETA